MTEDNRPSGRSDQDLPFSAKRSMSTLVIRTWSESDQAPGFRARLTFSQRPDEAPITVSTADPNEVLSTVSQWLSTQPGAAHQV